MIDKDGIQIFVFVRQLCHNQPLSLSFRSDGNRNEIKELRIMKLGWKQRSFTSIFHDRHSRVTWIPMHLLTVWLEGGEWTDRGQKERNWEKWERNCSQEENDLKVLSSILVQPRTCSIQNVSFSSFRRGYKKCSGKVVLKIEAKK